MTEAIGGGVVLALFILLTATVFSMQSGLWFDQSTVVLEATERHTERLETSIDIIEQNCGASDGLSVENTGHTLIANIFEMDVFVEYVTTTDIKRSARLQHITEWTITGISPDTRDPNVWNPQEFANFDLTLSPAMKDGTTGYLRLSTPNAVVSGTYISQNGVALCRLYLHNNPTPPTGATESQAVLPMDSNPPSATTLYNYDQDRDSVAGLVIQRGGTGPGESDPLKHQVWRTGSLNGSLSLVGDINIDFWSALKDYKAVNATTYYLHNNPTPPTADTDSQSVLPFDKSAPGATTLHNYDNNRDGFAGLMVKKAGWVLARAIRQNTRCGEAALWPTVWRWREPSTWISGRPSKNLSLARSAMSRGF